MYIIISVHPPKHCICIFLVMFYDNDNSSHKLQLNVSTLLDGNVGRAAKHPIIVVKHLMSAWLKHEWLLLAMLCVVVFDQKQKMLV